MRALVIDDSRVARDIVADILVELGFDVLKAANGSEALQVLRGAGKVEVILVDWIMPEMNGIDLVRAIRSEPAYDGLKLMMVTTQTEMPKVAQALTAGVDEYVMKPVTKEMIEEKLKLVGIAPAPSPAR